MKPISICYNVESKGYMLYHPQSQQILISCDVVFVEDVVQLLVSWNEETSICSHDVFDTLLPLFIGGSSNVSPNEANIQLSRVQMTP